VELASSGDPDEKPLLLATLLGEAGYQRHAFEALSHPKTRASALYVLGFLGTKDAMQATLDHLEDPELAGLAAESFCCCTGLSLEKEKLVIAPPEEESLPEFEDDDLDADLVPTPIDLLPLPDVDRVRSWWKRHEGAFASTGRYVNGREFSLNRLQAVLEEGPARRRHVAALELAIRTLGRCQVETRAFSRLQRKQMRGLLGVQALSSTT